MIRLTFAQLLASQGSYVLLTIIGVNVTLEGNVLNIVSSSGNIVPLNVANSAAVCACLSFIAAPAVICLVATRAWWKRVVLMAMTVP